MNVADYHTHTPLCMHAEGEPEQYIEKARSLGLKEYGIADHAPVQPEPFDDWRMLMSQLPDYFLWIERAKKAAGAIPVRVGLECDWLPGCEPWIETIKGEYEWDYLIGSVHYLADKWDFDNPKWLGKWAETDVEKVWKLYWESYTKMVRSGLFQIHAHPDLIKKFGYKPEGELKRYYEPAIQALIESGGTIEINTAGWYKPCEEQYPDTEFLKICASAGVSLIISSDAHAPSEVGRDFKRARQVAIECGFKETVLFEKGEKTSIIL